MNYFFVYNVGITVGFASFAIYTATCHAIFDDPGEENPVVEIVTAACDFIRRKLFDRSEPENPVPAARETASDQQNSVSVTSPVLDDKHDEEFITETRDTSPTHFLAKIESFSLFFEYGIDKYETMVFEAGDYKWRLVIYPYGKGKNDYHVSVHLAMAETTTLPMNWDLNVIFTIFLYNHNLDKYQSFRVGRDCRFNKLNSEWGFSKLISRNSLEDKSSGYVVDDNLVLGAEVFVLKKRQRAIECVTLLKPSTCLQTYDWKIPKFSNLKDVWTSQEFLVRGFNWKMKLYLKGDFSSKKPTVAIDLVCISADTFTPHQKIKAEFHIRLKGKSDAAIYESGKLSHWFTSLDTTSGTSSISLGEKNFLVDDCCTIQVEICVQVVA